ncbi:hypothetical protein [uncultured Arcticibacterium sp.]|uniref:hypothetical protein n=1 Tax=uncultured Arcticibacterium sp. TaxID=2173042 RepID=UPI0030F9B9D0
MIRFLYFLFVLAFVAVSCSEKSDVITEKSPYIKVITDGDKTWFFEYDENNQISNFKHTAASGSFSTSFVYNEKGLVSGTTLSATEVLSTQNYEYDSNGYMTAIFQKSEAGEYAKTSELLNESGRIWIKPTNASEIAGDIYYLQDENVVSSSCFDCPLSSFKFEYYQIESIIPKNLRKYWHVYNHNISPKIPFLHSSLKIGSKNLIERYYLLDKSLLPIAVRNQVNLDENTGLPTKIEVIVEEGLTLPKDLKVGDLLSTYFIEYVYL